MTPCAAGQLLCGSDGGVHIHSWDDRYYISPGNLGLLFFVGGPVPVLKIDNATTGISRVAGNASLSLSGRAVILEIDRQRYMVPRDKFLAIAFGEVISAIFYEAPEDRSETEIIYPRQGGATS